MKNRLTPLLVLPLLLAACATPNKQAPKVDSISAEIEAKIQREMVVQNLVDMEARLARIAYPLLTKNAELCGANTAKLIGARFWNVDSFKAEWHETVRSLYGLTDLLQVGNVIAGSPADSAGLQTGDIVVTVDTNSPPTGKDAEKTFIAELAKIIAQEDVLRFQVSRGGEELTLQLTPVDACDFSVTITDDDTINAYADGKQMVFTTGMMDFAKNDQELALVLAHELAHNSEEHLKAKKTNAAIGGIVGLIVDIAAAAGGVNTQGKFTDIGMQAGASAYSVDFERNADYVGLYYMSRAGFEIEGAANFWRRMSLRNKSSISMASTHPSNAERFVGIERAIREIKGKVAANEPLIPEIIGGEPTDEAVATTVPKNELPEESPAEKTTAAPEGDTARKSTDPVTRFFKNIFGKKENGEKENPDE